MTDEQHNEEASRKRIAVDGSIWRDDIQALVFQPDGHEGLCMVHRHAFRTLLRRMPTPDDCAEFFCGHRQAFQAAARAKVLRADIANTANFHLTSRDVSRQMQN